MKNKIICLVLVFTLCIGIYLLKFDSKKEEYVYVAMGDFITSIEGSYSDLCYKNNMDKIDVYSKFLSRKSMTSSDLLRLLSIDASIVYDNHNERISSVIKKSDCITISLGYNDIMNNVRYNSITNKYSYDESVIDRCISILQSNIFDIIDCIYTYNKSVKLYFLSIYYPYPNVKNSNEMLYQSINESINEACIDGGATFIDISGVSNPSFIINGEIIPNEDGNDYIYNAIKSYLW